MALTSLQVCMDMENSASDQHHHWLQGTMHEDALMDSSSSPSGGDILACSGPSPILMSERRLRPPQDQALKCPRCDSTHTKFCYYNNYSLSQPRYFCKTCRRYWTKGGTLRNIPVGGGCRKNRKSSSSSSSKKPSSTEPLQVYQPLSSVPPPPINNTQINHNPNSSMTNMMMTIPNNTADLQLSFHNNEGFPFSHMNYVGSGASRNGSRGGMGGYSERSLFNSISLLESSSSGGLMRPIDFLDHKVESALVMNNSTSKSSSSNNQLGYFSSQFGGGYGSNNSHHASLLNGSSNVLQTNLGYAHEVGLNNSSSSYVDRDNTVGQFEYFSGLHGHPENVSMDCEAKPDKKMLAIEWQQEATREEAYGPYHLGSACWSGMPSSGSYHHHHHQNQLLLPSSTAANNSLV